MRAKLWLQGIFNIMERETDVFAPKMKDHASKFKVASFY